MSDLEDKLHGDFFCVFEGFFRTDSLKLTELLPNDKLMQG